MTTTKTETTILHGIECSIEHHLIDHGDFEPPLAWTEGTVDAEHDADTSVVCVQLWNGDASPEAAERTAAIVREALEAAAAVLAKHGIV